MKTVMTIGLTFIGFIGILFIMSFITVLRRRINAKTHKAKKFLYQRQSTIHGIIQPFLPSNEDLIRFIAYQRNASKQRQSKNEYTKEEIKVAVIGNKAYWVQNNTFYQTIVKENGEIDHSLAIPVDVTNITEEEANRLMDILDNIGKRGEANDSGSSGN